MVVLRYGIINAERRRSGVHLAYCNVKIEISSWSQAISDALDLDICSGSINNSTFEHSGNDGLDLMACNFKISNCQFVGSGVYIWKVLFTHLEGEKKAQVIGDIKSLYKQGILKGNQWTECIDFVQPDPEANQQ